jgi:hypothetical protein
VSEPGRHSLLAVIAYLLLLTIRSPFSSQKPSSIAAAPPKIEKPNGRQAAGRAANPNCGRVSIDAANKSGSDAMARHRKTSEHQRELLEIVSRSTMKRRGLDALGLLVACAVGGLIASLWWPAAVQAATFCDSTFSGWTLQGFSCPAGNTVSATAAGTGGSAITPVPVPAPVPTACLLNGSYRDVINTVAPTASSSGTCPSESTVYGVHIFNGFYFPSRAGAVDSIGFQIDYECLSSTPHTPCQSQGQGFGPALLQNGRYFVAKAPGVPTNITPGWMRFSTSTPLAAADFNEITTTGSGPSQVIKIDTTPAGHPDFSATAPAIQCGFYTADATQSAGYSIRAGYDNWVCIINPGILKICKVAGPGITAGTSFSFTANGTPFQVPAGLGPGGTCAVVGPGFPVGTTVNVAETLSASVGVSSITASPQPNLLSANPPAGTASIKIGSGVTEVTYTDFTKPGYLEICKTGTAGGSFMVSPGNLGPFVLAAGTCTPAIQVSPGTIAIQEQENPNSGTAMNGCTIIPSSRPGACNLVTQSATVTVVPGDVSTETILTVNNAPVVNPNPNTNPK